jgi:hypothetical protein
MYAEAAKKIDFATPAAFWSAASARMQVVINDSALAQQCSLENLGALAR